MNNDLDALGLAFTEDARLVQTNPTEGLKSLKEQPKWLSRREVGILVRAVQKYGNKKEQTLVILLLHRA